MESYTVSLPGSSTSIKLWTDDTIETVRMRIGLATGMHPDRLRIYVQAELPATYYSSDSRRWEEVFLRLSPEGKPVKKESLSLWESYTEPGWTFEQSEYDHSSWILLDSKKSESFKELRVLGALEDRSWVLPLDNTTEPPFLPPPAKVTLELKSLFSSIHPYPIAGFRVIPHTDDMKSTLESIYYPLLRMGSPGVVPDELARSITRQDELLEVLFERNSPNPTRQTVVRARWRIPLIDTDFGAAPRNRFEQIFYGTTVSKQTPAISFFGGKQEQSRHKFFGENKTPSVDLRTWQYWWTATKPSKNKPALLIYRGSARFVYDRITVTATELIVSGHRLDDSDESLQSLKKHLKEWLQSIDGLNAFLDEKDLEDTRWVLQDVSASLKYSAPLKEGDFRRFGCLRGLYEVIDHDKLLFKLLRADQSDVGLSPVELRIVQLLKDNVAVDPTEIADDLGISVDEASESLSNVQSKLVDNPDLLDKQYSNLPTFRFTASNAIVTFAIDMKRIVQYINILRDILLNPDDSTLDAVCPSRLETVETAQAEAPPPQELVALDEEDNNFLDDLLGEIADTNNVVVAEPKPVVEKAKKKVSTKQVTTLATYFLTQLREFDSQTYDPDDPQILRKCDKPRQPIVLNPADLARLSEGEYDPHNAGPSAVLDVKDPDGAVICPAYWCTHDRIPLTKEQLVDNGCPVCKGKVRSTDKAVEKTQDIIEYPVIERDPSIVFPGYVKYKSKKNDRNIPCCFTTAQTTKLVAPKETVSTSEAFYVLAELRSRLSSLRLGYIPSIVGKALGIPLNYANTIAAGNRIQTGQGGFYRVGVGHAVDTLPQIIGFTGKIKNPLTNVAAVMRCSFFRTWRGADEQADPSIIPASFSYREKLAERVASIDKAFQNKTLSPLEELEYAAISLDCKLYVLYVTSEQVELGCFMNIGAVRAVNRSLAVMITNGEPEYISYVGRSVTVPDFQGNLYKNTVFPPGVLKKLIDFQKQACNSDLPTIDSAILFVNSSTFKMKLPQFQVVMDPYGRAQAIYIPKEILLPFKPTSQIPTFFENRVAGYSDIAPDDFPAKSDMLDILKQAIKFHTGYQYAHDLGNKDSKTVELITRSGLRIPVTTEEWATNTSEITETVRNEGEDTLVWGEPDKVAAKESRAITYEAEVFDFLLYQLSYDIHHGEEYNALKTVLAQNRPSVQELKPLLAEWMDETLHFTQAEDPPTFVSKLRSPCSKQSCDGSLCYQNGSSCRVEVKQVRPSLDKAKLEKRLLHTLATNEKLRDIVWEEKASPFFSSVLYLEMPTEVILSDAEVARRLRV